MFVSLCVCTRVISDAGPSSGIVESLACLGKTDYAMATSSFTGLTLMLVGEALLQTP